MNQPAANCSLQLDSTGVKATRVKVAPPSSERRATQPPAAKTELGVDGLDLGQVGEGAAQQPLHVAPPSVVRKSVPKSPAA